jgi:hypothetical protein
MNFVQMMAVIEVGCSRPTIQTLAPQTVTSDATQ